MRKSFFCLCSLLRSPVATLWPGSGERPGPPDTKNTKRVLRKVNVTHIHNFNDQWMAQTECISFVMAAKTDVNSWPLYKSMQSETSLIYTNVAKAFYWAVISIMYINVFNTDYWVWYISLINMAKNHLISQKQTTWMPCRVGYWTGYFSGYQPNYIGTTEYKFMLNHSVQNFGTQTA